MKQYNKRLKAVLSYTVGPVQGLTSVRGSACARFRENRYYRSFLPGYNQRPWSGKWLIASSERAGWRSCESLGTGTPWTSATKIRRLSERSPRGL